MTTEVRTDEPISLAKYYGQFAMFYILATLATIAMVKLLKFEIPSSMGIIVMMTAAGGPMTSFVQTTKRLPTKGERARYATGTTVIGLLLSLAILAVAAYAMGGTEDINYFVGEAQKLWNDEPMLAAALPFISFFVSWLVVYFGSAFFAKQVLKGEAAKAGKI